MRDNHLEWSNLLKGSDADGGSPLIDIENYLFETQTFIHEFMVVDEEMAQLNDYCLLILNATNKKISDFKTELEDYKSGKQTAQHSEIGDITEDVISGLEEVIIPTWQDTYGFTTIATCILLIQSFIEKNLKSILYSLAGESKKYQQVAGESKIDCYLRKLEEDFGVGFDESSEGKQLRKEINSLRNNFAHGDWGEVRKNIASIDLRNVFQMATNIFEGIEDGFPK